MTLLGSSRYVYCPLNGLKAATEANHEAQMMVQLFKDFGTSKKLGFFSAQDTDSYNTVVRSIRRALKALLAKYQRANRRFQYAALATY